MAQIITTEQMVKILDSAYKKALDGIPGVSQSVDDFANDYLSRHGNPKQAARELAKWQVTKCGTTGFVAGLGGLITLPVAIPANLASVLYVQLRMVAAIAKMGGYDVNSDQVQTMVYACITGNAIGEVLKDVGAKIGKEALKVAIKKIPGKVLISINQRVGFRLVTKAGTTGAINLTKLVPIAGGVVNGAFDIATTKIIARNAQSIFIEGKIPHPKNTRKNASPRSNSSQDVQSIPVEPFEEDRNLHEDPAWETDSQTELYCPNCEAALDTQSGFDPSSPTWTCQSCGMHLMDPNLPHRNGLEDIAWYCDGCSELLNVQDGFIDSDDTWWTCTNCGQPNLIIEEDALDCLN